MEGVFWLRLTWGRGSGRIGILRAGMVKWQIVSSKVQQANGSGVSLQKLSLRGTPQSANPSKVTPGVRRTGLHRVGVDT